MKNKLDILMQENSNLRAEIIVQIKNIHSCLFSFFASLGLFVGILLSLDRNKITYNYDSGMLAFLVSQVGILIIFLAANIQGDVNCKAAYISYIEKKINTLLEEKIIFWESEIASKQHRKGAFATSQWTLFLSYFFSFIFLAIYSFDKMTNSWLLAIQIIEVIILFVLSFQMNREFLNVAKHINGIENETNSIS